MSTKRHGRTTCVHCGQSLDNGQPLTSARAAVTSYRLDAGNGLQGRTMGDAPLPAHDACHVDAAIFIAESRVRAAEQQLAEYAELAGPPETHSDNTQRVMTEIVGKLDEARTELEAIRSGRL